MLHTYIFRFSRPATGKNAHLEHVFFVWAFFQILTTDLPDTKKDQDRKMGAWSSGYVE